MAEPQPVRSLGAVSGQVRNSSVTQIQLAEPLTAIVKRLQQQYVGNMRVCVCDVYLRVCGSACGE